MRDPASLKISGVDMFHAIMSSVHVPMDYPIVGAFKQLSEALVRVQGGVSDRASALAHDPNLVENHLHKVVYASASRRAVLRFMEDRYGITEREVIEVEGLILSVCSLPVMVCHVAFEKMRHVDYQ